MASGNGKVHLENLELGLKRNHKPVLLDAIRPAASCTAGFGGFARSLPGWSPPEARCVVLTDFRLHLPSVEHAVSISVVEQVGWFWKDRGRKNLLSSMRPSASVSELLACVGKLSAPAITSS